MHCLTGSYPRPPSSPACNHISDDMSLWDLKPWKSQHSVKASRQVGQVTRLLELQSPKQMPGSYWSSSQSAASTVENVAKRHML